MSKNLWIKENVEYFSLFLSTWIDSFTTNDEALIVHIYTKNIKNIALRINIIEINRELKPLWSDGKEQYCSCLIQLSLFAPRIFRIDLGTGLAILVNLFRSRFVFRKQNNDTQHQLKSISFSCWSTLSICLEHLQQTYASLISKASTASVRVSCKKYSFSI